MPLFLSTYANKIDKKGRVSVPASFRAEFDKDDPKFVAFPHTGERCIEGWDRARIGQLTDAMDRYPPLSSEYNALGYLLGQSREMSVDPEGRITLPLYLLEYAGITDSVVFVGQGKSFQIWSPENYEEFGGRMRPVAASVHRTLALGPLAGGGAHG
ncbi:division/cell wall cluster transcriptional repressor MraZ [Iodidimonas sp. SYSU 1G8]|uniref:division/cell wall cluster transcriptional repressor MraZ n=1 Tax=Iodidimonas sp. SYSU 1G8 TaxID=3133967 RepID=UPI0031FEE790